MKDRAIEKAQEISSLAPIAVRAIKEVVVRGLSMDLPNAIRFANTVGIMTRFTEDAKEGRGHLLRREIRCTKDVSSVRTPLEKERPLQVNWQIGVETHTFSIVGRCKLDRYAGHGGDYFGHRNRVSLPACQTVGRRRYYPGFYRSTFGRLCVTFDGNGLLGARRSR